MSGGSGRRNYWPRLPRSKSRGSSAGRRWPRLGRNRAWPTWWVSVLRQLSGLRPRASKRFKTSCSSCPGPTRIGRAFRRWLSSFRGTGDGSRADRGRPSASHGAGQAPSRDGRFGRNGRSELSLLSVSQPHGSAISGRDARRGVGDGDCLGRSAPDGAPRPRGPTGRRSRTAGYPADVRRRRRRASEDRPKDCAGACWGLRARCPGHHAGLDSRRIRTSGPCRCGDGSPLTVARRAARRARCGPGPTRPRGGGPRPQGR